MVQPQPSEEDELLPELPALDGEVDEESFEPGDDSDLGLDEERDLGLDSEAGLDEPLEGELASEEEEAGSWLDDGKEASPSADEDALDADGENESNLTEGSEPAADTDVEDWAEDFVFDESGGGDSGEEGFDDESVLPGFELEPLPPLDGGGAQEDDQPVESDPFATELLAELRTNGEDDDAPLELLPGLRCTRMPAERVELALLARTGRPLAQLCAAGDVGIAWDSSALLVAEGAGAPERLPYAGSVLALTAARTAEGVAVALATPAGVVWSRDGGRHFSEPARVADAGVCAALALTPRADGIRLWAVSAAGPLWASDDRALSFRCVLPEAHALRIASDDARGLVLLERGEQGRARTLRSNDAGQSFERIELPVNEPERVQQLQIAGEALLCCRRAPVPQVVVFDGRGWRALAHATAPALLLDEQGEPAVYFFVPSTGGAQLLRQRVDGADGAASAPQIVADLPAEAGAPLQLCGAHAGGVTSLQIGSERAWHRLRVRSEGSPR